MICPSDYLEPVIDKKLKGDKYFYTSLGNTVTIDKNTVEQIVAIVENNEVNEITFVLSEDNGFVSDALNNQSFGEIRGLTEAYGQLLEYKKQVLNSWLLSNQRTIILSYFLNEKIKVLKSRLQYYLPNPPEINGKLFSKSSNSFKMIHSELVCINSYILN